MRVINCVPASGNLLPQTLRMMKLTFLLLTAAFIQVSARGVAQHVTLSLKDAPMEKVFREIERQTGYGFLYTKKMLKDMPRVTINVTNAPVKEVLDECLRGQSLEYTIDNQTIVINVKHHVEEDLPKELPLPIDVNGRVLNDKGEAVVGVSVIVKGTQIGTTTDAQGYFRLKGLNNNATLVFTGVNVETFELRIDGRNDLGSITLKTKLVAEQDLMITASTGYQTISKERATGAFDVVGRDILDKRPVSNISTALQGLVAGLQAKENLDGSMDFLIRGTSSLYAGRSPLVVVDGFPIIGSDFSNLNPNDVESITVLKDAAAASIWGARAANGVIVITTKRPKVGRDQMTVEVNAFTRVSSMIDLDQVMSQANTAGGIL